MKTTRKSSDNAQKKTVKLDQSTDNEKVVWVYDKIDKNGSFSFDIFNEHFDHKGFLSKMIDYSNMTWSEVKRQTHDDNKSKHHFLSVEQLSKEARDRLVKLHLDEYSDNIFSFAFESRLRIIGIRIDEYFHVLWYDPKHEVCPSSKKNT